MKVRSRYTFDQFLAYIPYFIIGAGIVLRIAVFLSNRSLILDEVNVARNLFERNMLALAAPLSYHQFAPPLFLWSVKLVTLFFGFGEQSLRLFPFISGIASLWLMMLVLKRAVSLNALWYPLLLMSSGYIYIRYGTELKQYSSDVVITLGLLLLALKIDLLKVRPLTFVAIWCIAGSLAIWFSMPAVFVLAGVFGYYLSCLIRQDRSRIGVLVLVGAVWGAQFLVYYFLLLKNEIRSDYLQSWHKDYFLIAIPRTTEQFIHNLDVCNNFLGAAMGNTTIAIAFNLLLLVIAVVFLVRKNAPVAILLLLPLVCLLGAAAFHKFTLLPRVVLFILPVILILSGIGLEQLLKVRSAVVRYSSLIIIAICLVNFNNFQYIFKPFEVEEFKKGFDIAQQERINARHFYISDLITPIYFYYTNIHPSREKWKDLAGANQLAWNTNYDSLLQTFTGKSAVLYEGGDETSFNNDLAVDHKYCKTVVVKPFEGGRICILTK